MNNEKLITIEIPTINKFLFENNYLNNNLEYFKLISKYIKFNVNFQKDFTVNDLKLYDAYFKKLGLEHSFNFKQYENYPSSLKLREDTHLIDNTKTFSLLLDDDFFILNDNYIKDLLACIYELICSPDIGIISIDSLNLDKNKSWKMRTFEIVKKNILKDSTDIEGGLLIRNINSTFLPLSYLNFSGGNFEKILMLSYKNLYNLDTYQTTTYSFLHEEFKNNDIYNFSSEKYNWKHLSYHAKNGSNKLLEQLVKDYKTKNSKIELHESLDYFYSSIDNLINNIDEYIDLPLDTKKEKKCIKFLNTESNNIYSNAEIIKKILDNKIDLTNYNKKYLLSIEMPTCSKKVFEEQTLPYLMNYKAISKYIKFNVNFQKDFTENDCKNYQKLFEEYGLKMDYEIHLYNNPKGYNSIVRFREDTHQIDSSCLYILSTDDDNQILSPEYSRKLMIGILAMLMNFNSLGVIGLSKGFFRRDYFKRFRLNQTNNAVGHEFWTVGGTIVKNLHPGSYLYYPETQDALGTGQDTLLGETIINQGYRGQVIICPDEYSHRDNGFNAEDSGYVIHGWYLTEYSEHSLADIKLKLKKENAEKIKNYPVVEEWNFTNITIEDICYILDNTLYK